MANLTSLEGARRAIRSVDAPDSAPAETTLDVSVARQLWSIEATPRWVNDESSGREQVFSTLDVSVPVFLPLLPGASIEGSIRAAGYLSDRGHRVVPHVAARAIPSVDALRDTLARFAAAGVGDFMLVGGDRDEPAGPFGQVLDLLRSDACAFESVRSIGVTGYPEGHPAITRPELVRVLCEKQAYARSVGVSMFVVSQFAFSADAIRRWRRELRDHGVELPVRIGIAGPANLLTITRYAAQCGVALSARMLARSPSAGRMAFGWSPDRLLADLWSVADDASRDHLAMHVFPFGGVPSSLDWMKAQLLTSDASQVEE
jgi:methylenetetrahydrofolate reductase (NADPH)